jgi:glycerophosphoryl diester phosphodiesterase
MVVIPLMMATPSLHAQPVLRADRPEIVAHRGASFDAPENTLAAVRLGWKQGADAVEVDIYLTRDHRVVCLHDPDLKRTTGDPRPIHEVTLAEVRELEAGAWKGPEWAGEPVPLLEHVLRTVPEGKRIFVELKTGPEIVPHLVPLIRQSGKKPEQIAFISFKSDSCVAIKKQLPDHRVYLLHGFKEKDGVLGPPISELIKTAQAAGVDGLDLSHKGLLRAEDMAAIRSAGLFLAAYTVNEPVHAQDLFTSGVQSITTDKPGLLLRYFQKP